MPPLASLACRASLLATSTQQQSTKSRKWHFPFTRPMRV